MILLDTDVCIEILRGNQTVIEKRNQCDEKVAICFMSIGELYYGANRSNNIIKNVNLVDEFLVSIDIIHPDKELLRKYGEIKSSLYQKNILLPDADILIASTSLSKCSMLVTGNVKHFKRFENLILDNWIK
jgi:tRNA(fMet)-specific endonuclease VapC